MDLLVNLTVPSSTVVRGELTHRLEGKLGKSVDLHPYSSVREDPSVLAEILETGRVILDKVGLWKQMQYDMTHQARQVA